MWKPKRHPINYVKSANRAFTRWIMSHEDGCDEGEMGPPRRDKKSNQIRLAAEASLEQFGEHCRDTGDHRSAFRIAVTTLQWFHSGHRWGGKKFKAMTYLAHQG